MSFLNPSFLWFLPLAALPVLIHFIFSVKPVKIEFSSVFLLRPVQRARRRPTRLLQTLILLLRCLAVLLLVFAFSKPVIESGPLSSLSGFAAGAGRPLSLVILADRSYSMSASFGGRTRYAFAAGNVERILGALGKEDEAALVFFDETAEPGADWTADFGAVSKALSAARPGYKATDYGKALEKAYGLLAARPAGRKKAALLLSDSTRNGFAGFPKNISAIPAYDPQVVLLGFSFAPGPNSWIREVNGRAAGRAVELSAYLGGEGGGGEAGLFISPSRGSMEKTIPGLFRNGASAFDIVTPGPDPAGRIELTGPDALNSDNAAYFAFQRAVPREPRALTLYSGERALRPGGGAYFIKKFFETGSGRSSVLRADFAQYSEERIRLEDYGAIILAGPPAAAEWTKAVKDYLSSGGGVFLIAVPGGGESSGREQGVFWEAFGLKSGGVLDGKFSLAQARDAAFFAGEDFSGFDLSRAVAGRIAALEGTSHFETPWNFKDEAGNTYPALLYKQQGKGRFLVWTSSLDLGFADLPAKPVFAPFMALNVKRLFGLAEPELRSAPVGGIYEGRLKSADRVRVAVTAPDGAKHYLFSEGGAFKYGLTSRPGLYRWSAPPEAGMFAVNLDHRKGESALLAEKHPPWRVLRPEEPAADFKSALYGVETSQFLLFTALALLLAEFLLSRKVI